MQAVHAPDAYRAQRHDRVRDVLERGFFARAVPALLARSGGGALLDLGCGDGLMGRLAGPSLTRYTGVDFRPPGTGLDGEHVLHDLREGLGPIDVEPYDCYLASFGVASHLRPPQLRRLLAQIARHARPGAIVALEALGLRSLEWPRLWDTQPGAARTLTYRLGADVEVHPWSPRELAALYEEAGVEPLYAVDRSLQAGPKLGEPSYWRGLPTLRAALDALLDGRSDAQPPAPRASSERRPSADEAGVAPPTAEPARDPRATLAAPLGPLPAGSAAAAHHALAQRRRRLLDSRPCRVEHGPALARAIWALERGSGGGLGHGLLAVGRVR